MKVFLITALIVFVLLGDGEGIAYDSQEQERFVYEEKIKVAHQLLASECPDYVEGKREVDDLKLHYHVTIARKVYENLVEKLIECRKRKSMANQTISTLPTTPTTTVPPTTTPSTTAIPTPVVPKECLTATNLTESWRLDHNGSDIKPGGPHSWYDYACDFHKDLQWFRFTGSGGNRMLNYCLKEFSCGTAHPYWSDEEVPKVVGVPTTITAYLSRAPDYSCKYSPDRFNRKVEVMRCSLNTDHDLIYKYTPHSISINHIGNDGYYDTCAFAFCGMM